MRNNPASFLRAVGDAGIDLHYYDLDLSVARVRERFGLSGTFLYSPVVAFDDPETVSATLTTGQCIIRFGKQTGTPTYYSAGEVHRRDPFDEVFVSNEAQAGKMLRLYYGVGNAILPFVSKSGVSLVGGDNFVSTGDVTVGAASTDLLVAARAGRKEALITNVGANTLRIGDAGAGAAEGLPLAPNASMVLTTQGAIYAYNPGGAGNDVAVVEIY